MLGLGNTIAIGLGLALTGVGAMSDLDQLRAKIVPAGPETWQTIDWRTDLAAARGEAAREGKLLFLWSMNGHPCGST